MGFRGALGDFTTDETFEILAMNARTKVFIDKIQGVQLKISAGGKFSNSNSCFTELKLDRNDGRIALVYWKNRSDPSVERTLRDSCMISPRMASPMAVYGRLEIM